MKRAEYRVMFEVEDSFWWYQGMRQATAAVLDSLVGSGHALDILDAGCGSGKNLEFLASYGRPIGIDLSSEALTFAAKRGRPVLTRGSICNLPFADSSFDLVTTFEVIYHLAVDDDSAAIAEMARVLRPGGRLLARVPAYDWLRGSHDRAVQTRHRYTVAELSDKIREAGLMVERSTYLNMALFPLAAAKRAVEMVIGTGSESDLKPINPRLNRLFSTILAAEGRLSAIGPLPFGLSALCIARKL